MAAVLADLAARSQDPALTSRPPSGPPRPRPAPGSAPQRAAGPEPVFRADLEGLRAVAILLVVLYHAGQSWVPGGFVGVDVFFVISGFLIASHLVREVEGTGGLGVARFYARRVLRLVPAASLVIAATLVAGWWWLPATRLRGLVADAVAANVYAINYRLARSGTDYRTADGAPSPLQHFWSLAVEEQFYLVVPLLLLVTLVWARSRAAFVVLVAAGCGVSLWWSVHTSATSPVWAYFGAPTRAWELGAGVLLALAARSGALIPADSWARADGFGPAEVPAGGPAWAGRPVPVLRWGGLAAIGLAAATFDAATVFPGWAAAVPVLGAVAVIAASCLDPAAGSGSPLGARAMRVIGARSYSWYLWHWPVLLIGPFAVGRAFGPLDRLLAVGVAFVLAALTFSCVEQPVRNAARLRASPARAGALGVALTAGALALALLLGHLPARALVGAQPVPAARLDGEGSARSRALAEQLRAAELATELPANLTPSLREAVDDDPRVAADGCLVSFAGTSTPRHCESYGDPSSTRTVVLFGDSHAAQWYTALDLIARRQHWRLAVFTKVVCSAADVTIYLDPKQGAYDECVTWRDRSLVRIRELAPELVVTTSLADRGDLVGVQADVDGAWARAWTSSVRRLAAPGTRVVYLSDTPAPRGDVPECLSMHPQAIGRCAQARSQAAGSARRALTADAAARAGARVVDTVPWFCGPASCPPVVGDILVYRDASHVSSAYVRLLAPLLAERLGSAEVPSPAPSPTATETTPRVTKE